MFLNYIKGSPFKRAVAAGPPSQQFDFASNPFLGRANSAKLYSAPGYLPPDQPTKPPTVPCAGNGRACVPKYQCSNGVIDANQVRGSNSQVRRMKTILNLCVMLSVSNSNQKQRRINDALIRTSCTIFFQQYSRKGNES